jgi:hypothetical protein
VHRTPETRWTLAELAAEASASRALPDAASERCSAGPRSAYLTEWRMHLAQELLSTMDLAGTVHR